MIFESSSDSFGSDGDARTSETLSRFNCRRSSADTCTPSYLVASLANRAPASLAA